MKSVAVIAMATLLLLAGCSKSNQHPTGMNGQPNVEPAIKTFSYSAADNPYNPMDSVGKLHNILLDSLRKYVKRTNDTTHAGRGYYLSYLAKTFWNYDYIPTKNEALERKICIDYKSVMLVDTFSVQAKNFITQMISVLEGIESTKEFGLYAQKIRSIEQNISSAGLPVVEQKYLFVVASLLRHSGYYWMDQFEQGYVTQKAGIFGFLRKVAGVIAGIAADATTAGYHYLKNSPIDHLVIESAWMSEVCGYYTGWY